MKTNLKLFALLLCLLIVGTGYAQLHLERDFGTGPGNSDFFPWVEIGGKMYFSANDSHFGYELWQFDLLSEEAQRITDLNPASGSAYPREIVEYNGAIYFTAWIGAEGHQIFKLDPETYVVERVTTQQDDDFQPAYLCVYQGKLWFSASDTDGDHLWNYDAANGDFTMILPPAEGHPSQFRPQAKFVYNDQLYMSANTPADGYQLWSYTESNGFEKVPTQFDGQQSFIVNQFSACSEALMLNVNGDWYHYEPALDSCIFLVRNNSGFYRGGNCLLDKFWVPDYDENDVRSYDPNSSTFENLKDLTQAAPFQPYSTKSSVTISTSGKPPPGKHIGFINTIRL